MLLQTWVIILCVFITLSVTFHITCNHLTLCYINILISKALICHMSVYTICSMSHLLSHSLVIRVVNSVVCNDSIGFGRRVPQQGDRGGGHICKSHILRRVKRF